MLFDPRAMPFVSLNDSSFGFPVSGEREKRRGGRERLAPNSLASVPGDGEGHLMSW